MRCKSRLQGLLLLTTIELELPELLLERLDASVSFLHLILEVRRQVLCVAAHFCPCASKHIVITGKLLQPFLERPHGRCHALLFIQRPGHQPRIHRHRCRWRHCILLCGFLLWHLICSEEQFAQVWYRKPGFIAEVRLASSTRHTATTKAKQRAMISIHSSFKRLAFVQRSSSPSIPTYPPPATPALEDGPDCECGTALCDMPGARPSNPTPGTAGPPPALDPAPGGPASDLVRPPTGAVDADESPAPATPGPPPAPAPAPAPLGTPAPGPAPGPPPRGLCFDLATGIPGAGGAMAASVRTSEGGGLFAASKHASRPLAIR